MESSQSKTYTIEGLTCPDCAARIQGAVGQMEGIEDCIVEPRLGTITVQLITPDVPLVEIAEIVDKTGHRLLVEEESAQERASPQTGGAVVGFLRFIF